MSNKDLSGLMAERQANLQSKMNKSPVEKNIKNRIWVLFHKRNFMLIIMLIISMVLTANLTGDKLMAVIHQGYHLGPTLQIIGLGMIATIVIIVLGVFLSFLVDE